MGADGIKKVAELSAAAIEKSGTNLFAFSPKKSYVEEGWIKADWEFWKPKSSAPATKKTEEKMEGEKAAKSK